MPEHHVTLITRVGCHLCDDAGLLLRDLRDELGFGYDELDVDVPPLDELAARAVGLLCGRTRYRDVIDVHVALHARENGHTVVTSDPRDVHAIDPRLAVIEL